MPNQNIIDRRRAELALKHVESVGEAEDGKLTLKYKSMVEALPTTIRQIGLGPTLGLLLSRAKGGKEQAYKLLYDHLADWLRNDNSGCLNDKKMEPIKAIQSLSQADYIVAQTETQLFAQWLKKFSNAFLSETVSEASTSD